MKIKDSVALVTGANRGLGLAFTEALLAGGARKVYAAARDLASVKQPGVQPVRLDVTQPEQVEAAAREFGDVNLLINNAGIIRGTGVPDSGRTRRDACRIRRPTSSGRFLPHAPSRRFWPGMAVARSSMCCRC